MMLASLSAHQLFFIAHEAPRYRGAFSTTLYNLLLRLREAYFDFVNARRAVFSMDVVSHPLRSKLGHHRHKMGISSGVAGNVLNPFSPYHLCLTNTHGPMLAYMVRSSAPDESTTLLDHCQRDLRGCYTAQM